MMEESLLRLGTAAASILALGAVGVLAFDIVVRERLRIHGRLRSEFRQQGGARGGRQSLFRGLEELTLGASDEERLDLQTQIELLIEQSGVKTTPSRVAIATLICLLGCGGLGYVLTGHWTAIIAGAALGAVLPWLGLHMRRARRFKLLRQQLPEAFDLMSRSVRAGQSLAGAMRLVGQELTQPIAGEFTHCCEQQNLGLPHDVTLRELARRNGIMEFRIFVVALLVQRQSGGNPIELLDGLALRIRKRSRLQDRVKALTSEGRMQAIVLGVLPLLAFAAITVLDPNYASVLTDRPQLLLGLFIAQITGALWIRKIINFDY